MKREALAYWEENVGFGEEVEVKVVVGDDVDEETSSSLASGEEVEDGENLLFGDEEDEEMVASGEEEVDEEDEEMVASEEEEVDEEDEEVIASGEEVDEEEEEVIASGEEVDEEEEEMIASGEEVDEEDEQVIISGDEVDDDEIIASGKEIADDDNVDVDTDGNNGDEPPRSDSSALHRRTGIYNDLILQKNDLYAAAHLCIRTETELITRYGDVLPSIDYSLSQEITRTARFLTESDVEHPAADAALLAVTAEAKLMCEMFGVERCEKTLLLSGRMIRVSALGVMLYRGSFQSVISAVNLTMASNFLLDARREISDTVLGNRLSVADDFAHGTTGNACASSTGSTEEPIGSGTVGEDLLLTSKAELWKDWIIRLLQEPMRDVKVLDIVVGVCFGVFSFLLVRNF